MLTFCASGGAGDAGAVSPAGVGVFFTISLLVSL